MRLNRDPDEFRAKTPQPAGREKGPLSRGLPQVSDTVAASALVNYHLGRQRPMMGEFLDALGIAHEEGLIKEKTVVKPESEKLRAAVDQVAGQYPAEDVALYFSTLVSQDPETWGEFADLPQTASRDRTSRASPSLCDAPASDRGDRRS